MEETVDLLTLQRAVKEGLQDLFPGKLWVKAEIASIQARASGHCYLELVQSENGVQKAKVKGIIWASLYPSIAFAFKQSTGSPLAVGQQVLLHCLINYSELYSLSLIIDDISPEFTLGDAERRRRETIAALEKEDLIEKQKSLKLSPLPYRLAVISAHDAAGYGDFKRHLSSNAYGFRYEVSLFEALMQGAAAPSSISDALEQVELSSPAFDAVLILRGGGSNLDLACFDDYGLCSCIALCSIPVFTAIGHERDSHVADMVAYRAVKTPTALADEFIDMYCSEDERISFLENSLRTTVAAVFARLLSSLDEAERRMEKADPRAVLSRGYTLAAHRDGTLVRSAGELAPGDELRIVFADGEKEVRVL